MIENIDVIHEKISKKLKKAGYKLTPQREVTVATLIEYRTEFLTAEELFMAVKNKNPTIGLATVYRTLDLLDDLGIVRKVQFHDGSTRYDLIYSSNSMQPYYLICTNCGKIKEMKEDFFEVMQSHIEKNNDFKVMYSDITFHGVCGTCRKRDSD